MNYLAGYLLERRLLEHEAPKLDALERHIQDTNLRIVLRAVRIAPTGTKAAALDEILSSLPAEVTDECMAAIAWAQHVGPQICSDAIAAQFPMPADISLGEAGMTFNETEWLWLDWIPFGYLTVLAGRPGVGKSQLALAFAAAAMGKQPWPDLGKSKYDELEDKRSDVVVWIDTEGSQPMLFERCQKRGLPDTKIRWPLDPQQEGNPTPSWKLDDDRQWKIFTEYVDAWRPRLVVVDSLSGAVKGDENSSDMRFILQRLAEFARDHQTAILATHHAKKSNGPGPAKVIEDIDRLRGSSTIAQFARSIIAIDQPSDDDTRLRVRVIKSNLAKIPPAIGATLDQDSMWFDSTPPEVPKPVTNRSEATAFLIEALQGGKVPYRDLEADAKGRGIPVAALRSAARDLQVRKDKAGAAGTPWLWSLPARYIQNGNGNGYHRGDSDD